MLTVAQFLTVTSTTIVAVALPSLASDLGAGPTQQQWVVDAYVLVLAGLLVTGGSVADRFGGRVSFIVGLGCFSTGALICAAAPSVPVLLAGRVLQAIGPALAIPASLAVISALYPAIGERARAVGTWSLGAGVGMATGPLLGGVLVSAFSWHAVFWPAAGVAVVLAGLGWTLIPARVGAGASAGPGRRIDVVSSGLLMAAVGTLVYALIEGRLLGWGSPVIILLVVISVATAVAFVVRQQRRPVPLIDLRLFANRSTVAANLGGAVIFATLTATTVYLATFLQQVQDRGAMETGLLLLPVGAISAPIGQLAVRFAARFGARRPMTLGLVTASASCWLLTTVGATSSTATILLAAVLLGAGTGLCLPSMTVVAVTAAPPELAGMATALHQTCRQIGQALGVAVFGTVLFTVSGLSDADLTALATAAVGERWASGLNVAVALAGAALLVTAAIVRWLLPARLGPRSAGDGSATGR